MAYLVVLSTAPSKKSAQKLSTILINARAAACVGVLPGLESQYWWKNKKENTKEFLLIIKTKAACYKKIERLLKKHHPYQVPEIVVLPFKKGYAPYLEWLSKETRA